MFKRLIKFLTYQFAPYAVVIIPSNLFETKQVIHCWTRSDALEWMACSLRSDRVYMVRRGCKVQRRKVLSARYDIEINRSI